MRNKYSRAMAHDEKFGQVKSELANLVIQSQAGIQNNLGNQTSGPRFAPG
jgi:hypothetical protein